MTMQGRSFDVGMKIINQYPDKVHAEMSIMGMKIERILNGKKGVMKQMGQQRPVPAEQIEKGKFGDLYNICHNAKNYKFQYLKESVHFWSTSHDHWSWTTPDYLIEVLTPVGFHHSRAQFSGDAA